MPQAPPLKRLRRPFEPETVVDENVSWRSFARFYPLHVALCSREGFALPIRVAPFALHPYADPLDR